MQQLSVGVRPYSVEKLEVGKTDANFR